MNVRDAKTIVLACLGFLALGPAACVPDEPPGPTPGGAAPPPQATLEAFEQRYPAASDVAWSREKDYYIATFAAETDTVRVWIDDRGEWLMTADEQPRERLGRTIEEAFDRSPYAAWEAEEINRLDRPGMSVLYVLSVTDRTQYADVYFSRLGNLTRVERTSGSHTPSLPMRLPDRVAQTADSLLEHPEIVDVWRGRTSLNAAVLDDTSYCVVAFSDRYDWLCLLRDISPAETPAHVWEAFETSLYRTERPTRIRRMINAEGALYLFYLAGDGGPRRILCIDEDGLLHSLLTF
jgi:hypothetical protein